MTDAKSAAYYLPVPRRARLNSDPRACDSCLLRICKGLQRQCRIGCPSDAHPYISSAKRQTPCLGSVNRTLAAPSLTDTATGGSAASWPACTSWAYCAPFGAVGEPMFRQTVNALLWVRS